MFCWSNVLVECTEGQVFIAIGVILGISIVYWFLSITNVDAYSFNAVDATFEVAPYFFSHCLTRVSISSHIAIMDRGSNPAGSTCFSSPMKWSKSVDIAILNSSRFQSTPVSTVWLNDSTFVNQYFLINHYQKLGNKPIWNFYESFGDPAAIAVHQWLAVGVFSTQLTTPLMNWVDYS